MSETIVETTTETVETPKVVDPFNDNSWRETPEPIIKEESKQDIPAAEPVAAPVIDYNSYVKEKFGFDDEESLSKELERLKSEKASIEFANDDSRRLFEYIKEGKTDDVINILQTKAKIERLSTAPIDSVSIASEIIKTTMQAKYPDLTEDEIQRKFEKQFQIPQKPEQEYGDSDEEYEAKLSNWERLKSDIEKDIMIEAKIERKSIESLKSEIKFPDLGLSKQENAPTQEDLLMAKQLRDSYEAELENAAKTFNGFNVTAKSEDAEFGVAFVPTEAEKAAYKEKLFDFDSEQYLEQRWLKQDGTVDAQKAMRDLYLLENHDAILRKVANEAAAKMLEHIIKTRSNISLNGQGRQADPNFANKDEYTKMAETIWSA